MSDYTKKGIGCSDKDDAIIRCPKCRRPGRIWQDTMMEKKLKPKERVVMHNSTDPKNLDTCTVPFQPAAFMLRVR